MSFVLRYHRSSNPSINQRLFCGPPLYSHTENLEQKDDQLIMGPLRVINPVLGTKPLSYFVSSLSLIYMNHRHRHTLFPQQTKSDITQFMNEPEQAYLTPNATFIYLLLKACYAPKSNVVTLFKKDDHILFGDADISMCEVLHKVWQSFQDKDLFLPICRSFWQRTQRSSMLHGRNCETPCLGVAGEEMTSAEIPVPQAEPVMYRFFITVQLVLFQ